MDGGDSLKRILHQDAPADPGPRGDKESTELMVGPSCESKDSRTVAGDYYVNWDWVDRWVKAMLEEMLASVTNMVSYESLTSCYLAD